MTRIGIIGGGNVGSSLGEAWRAAGHDVTYGSRDPARPIAEAARDAEVVVLAVPYAAAADALTAAGDLHEKIVIDCTNPIGPDGLLVGTTTSGAEEIAKLVPTAHVVKAFNTTGAENMRDPRYAEHALVMLLAGDDDHAKAVVGELAEDLGFEAIDLGPLNTARYLEPFAMVWITLAVRRGLGRDIGFALLRR